MREWYLSLVYAILLAFKMGALKIKREGRSIWIGMNKKAQYIPHEVKLSARRAISKEMPLGVRLKWWRAEHHNIIKFSVRLAMSIVFLCIGMPIILGMTETTIDDNDTYAGFVDYDPHIHSNSKGDYVCFYNTQAADERICSKYSTDGGVTWSARIILFSNSTQLDGIIDDDVGGFWEMSGEVVNDILYCTFEIYPGTLKSVFSKCNISDVSNVAVYSNWKSADGTAVPSLGGGSDGIGYDLFAPPRFDPSIAVRGPNDIIIAFVNTTGAPKDLYIAHWDGTTWNLGTKDFPENMLAVPCIRRMRNGDLIIGALLDAADTNDYVIVSRCDVTADPTVDASWTKMDGTGDFDYVIDTGAGAIGWPNITVDSNNIVHVLSPTTYVINMPPEGPSYRRLFHNYYYNGTWVNGSNENGAGTQVNGILGSWNEPRIFQSNRVAGMNADANGNIIAIFTTWGGPGGDGTYTMFWDGSTQIWDYTTYTQQSTVKRIVSEMGHPNGSLTISPFMVSDTVGTKVFFIDVSGVSSGSAWWDDEDLQSKLDSMSSRLTTPYDDSKDSNNIKLLTVVAEQKSDIERVDTEITEGHNIEQGKNVSLDRLGELIACFRHTDEADWLYRNRLRDYLHGLIGGGTHEQLEHTIRAALPDITDDDFDIIDGYTISSHGDPNHYAHIKIRIRIGYDWVINNLYEMLDRARAAAITIDEFGPLTEETLVLTEDVFLWAFGKFIGENIILSETIIKDIDLDTIAEALSISEPRAGSPCHYCDITQVDSINYLCS